MRARVLLPRNSAGYLSCGAEREGACRVVQLVRLLLRMNTREHNCEHDVEARGVDWRGGASRGCKICDTCPWLATQFYNYSPQGGCRVALQGTCT